MKFIGIDLGWKSQPSRLCCLECIDGQLQLVDLDRKDAIADILTWIDQSVQPYEPAIIAVDAPTTQRRLPDKLSHKYFGKYHPGCYPAIRHRSRDVALLRLYKGSHPEENCNSTVHYGFVRQFIERSLILILCLYQQLYPSSKKA